jgi:uncharacterized protein
MSDLPIVDGHCHPPLRAPRPRDELEFLSLFTESRDARLIRQHVPDTLYFQQALRDLAAFHECAPTLADVLARRSALTPAALIARCVEQAGVVGLLVDAGYRTADSYSVDELRELLPATCRAWPVLRIEALLESLLGTVDGFAALEAAFAARLEGLRAAGYVALKSIIAYRGGLGLRPPDREAAAAAFAALRPGAPGESVRLTARALLEYFLGQACAAASREGLPVQLHTGFGDADLDLLRANPLLLRPALEAGAFGAAPVVLLHCYPYVREAAYLASLYANAYVDLSLTVPLVGPGCQRAVEEALELAPASKVLYGSDAMGLPESTWLGATAMRRALGGAQEMWVRSGTLTAARAQRVEEQILWRNAAGLYDLALPGAS